MGVMTWQHRQPGFGGYEDGLPVGPQFQISWKAEKEAAVGTVGRGVLVVETRNTSQENHGFTLWV